MTAVTVVAAPFPIPCHQHAGTGSVALCHAGIAPAYFFFNEEEDLHFQRLFLFFLPFFSSSLLFMCHVAWTNQQHVTLAPNEMLTNVDISNLIDV